MDLRWMMTGDVDVSGLKLLPQYCCYAEGGNASSRYIREELRIRHYIAADLLCTISAYGSRVATGNGRTRILHN